MKVCIICVGKIKENYIRTAIEDYKKRLNKYIKLNIIEVADEKINEPVRFIEEDKIKLKEANKILKYITNEFVIALCVDAKQMDSINFAKFFQDKMNNGNSNLVFIIGGALGLHKNIIERANYLVSFSKMTFPHQLVRLFLLEQIYRANKILKNEPYHK